MDLKLQQYADDLATITADAESDHAAQKIEKFCSVSGLQLNNIKAKKRHINLNNSKQLDIKHRTPESYIHNEVKIFGIIFDCIEIIPTRN